MTSLEETFRETSLRGGVRRNSQLPFYAQLMFALRQEFRDAAPHSPLPSEQALQEMFGVSRTVVRQALQELVYEGFIYREKGRGSYIAPPKVTEGQFQSHEGFAAEMARHGHEATTIVLEQTVTEADEDIARTLEIEHGAPVVFLRRLRLLGDRGFMIAQTWIPEALCPGLNTVALSDRSLYRVLREEYGLSFAGGSRIFEAVAATAELAQLLEIEVGAPLLRVELTNRLPDGRVAEHSVAHHRGDRARFELNVNGSPTEE